MAALKTKKELEKERKRTEKLAKFAKKHATATAPSQSKSKKPKTSKEELPPFIENTPAGEKKLLKPFEDPYYTSYHPVAVECAWYEWWEKQGYFKPKFTPQGDVKPEGNFVIVAPPPNVTGALQ